MASAERIEDYRIVITGVGGKTPVGDAREYRGDNNQLTAWENTLAGLNGITPIGDTDMASYPGYEELVPLKLAGGVKDNIAQDPFIWENRHKSKYWGRPGMMAAIAIQQALESARVDFDVVDRWRVGHYIGSVFGGNGHSHHVDLEKEKISVADGAKNLFGQVGLGPVSFFDLKGRGGVVATECASSLFATESGIGDLLPRQFGKDLLPPISDMVLVGGTDGTLVPEPAANFAKAFRGAPDILTEDPAQAPRPNDKNTKGFVISEGSVVMAMEPWHKAQERGLKEIDVLAEVVGFSSLTDAFNVTLAGFEGQVRTMKRAMEMGKVMLGETVYVREHGTGTLSGDAREALAIRELIRRTGLDPNDFFPNSTMWATGHTMGPAGILGLYYASMAVKYGIIPKPRKINDPISELTDPVKSLGLTGDLAELEKNELPQIPETNVLGSAKPDIAITNAYGFSGGGTTVAVRRFVA